jgi:hypothetical protein
LVEGSYFATAEAPWLHAPCCSSGTCASTCTSTRREIIEGLRGAPLTSGTNYGYTVISQQPDGTLIVPTKDHMSHNSIDSFQIDAAGNPV